MTPEFTVVITTFNRAKVLPRAIGSILSQTYASLQLVVVDDGSSDETRSVVQGWDDDRITYLRQHNAGTCAARNAGAAIAKGKYLVFLDDDDEAMPELLESFHRMIVASSPAVVCCGILHVNERAEFERVFLPHANGLFRSGTFAIRKDVFEAAGGYAPSIQRSTHTELALRVGRFCRSRGLGIEIIEKPLVTGHRHARPPSYARDKREGAKYILSEHPEEFADKGKLSKYLAIVGVNAARDGELEEARRFFLRAIAANPLALRNYSRFLVSFWPQLTRRIWSGTTGREREAGKASVNVPVKGFPSDVD